MIRSDYNVRTLGCLVVACAGLAAQVPGDLTLLERVRRNPDPAIWAGLHDWASAEASEREAALVLIREFLRKNASSLDDAAKPHRHTRLHLAAFRGQSEVVALLLDLGADIERGNLETGESPLLAATGEAYMSLYEVCRRDPETIRLLLARGADPKARNVKGRTALHGAAQFEDAGTVRDLIAKGVEVDARDADGRTPLHGVLHAVVVRELIAGGAKLTATDRIGSTPLHVAATDEAALALLDAGADPTERDEHGLNALQTLVLRESSEVRHGKAIERILKRGVRMDLHTAAALGRTRSVIEILDATPDSVRQRLGFDRRSALHHAARFGRVDSVRTLLDRAAEVDVTDRDGMTPLHLAILNGSDCEVARHLLEHDANPEAPTRDGRRPSHLAADQHDAKTLALLLQHGAAVDGRNEGGETPLHRVARDGQAAMVAILLASGADVHATRRNGETPLHVAVFGASNRHHDDAIELLLEAGADPDAKSPSNKSPFELAQWREQPAIVELLKRWRK